MLDIQLSNILIALAVTTGAGLATGIGGLLVFTTRAPNARLLAFGLAFAGGAMVFVSLSEILNKSIQSFSLAYGDNLGFTSFQELEDHLCMLFFIVGGVKEYG